MNSLRSIRKVLIGVALVWASLTAMSAEITGRVVGVFCHRVEAEVDQAHYAGHQVDLTEIGTWLVEHDPTICIIEVRVKVQVSVDVNVEFFIYDTIDHEELNFGSIEVSRDHEVEVDLFITLRGDLEHSAFDDLDPYI